MAHAERWLSSVTPRTLEAPPSWSAWAAARGELRAQLERRLGEFPPRPDLPQVTVSSCEEYEGYTLEKFQFENGLGMTVPGFLFLPKHTARKAPAILYCHWHGEQYDIGKNELLQTNAAPVAPGPVLARLGYVVLGIDACGFGERNGQGPGGPNERGAEGELAAAKFCLWADRTRWGVMIRDDRLALDYLCSRPEVDTRRIGVTGISMGSTRAWWLMALDERLRAASCIACMTRCEDLVRAESLNAHGIYYYVPGMLRCFDTEAVMALAAPRAMLFMTGDQDPGSPASGARKLGEKVAPFYQLAGAPGSFQSIIYPGVGHVCLPEMWQRSVDWLAAHLKNEP
ncbi:MAG: alpha/beta hydrolase [Roseimicrobium sp.]